MPVPIISLGVVAHRLYGTSYEVVEVAPDHDPPILFTALRPIVSAARLRRELRLFTDYGHGTTRSEENVRALFVRNPAYTYPDDKTPDDYYAPAEIHFSLIRVVDQMIDTHLADYMLQTSTWDVAQRLNEPGVLNVYFVRDMN